MHQTALFRFLIWGVIALAAGFGVATGLVLFLTT